MHNEMFFEKMAVPRLIMTVNPDKSIVVYDLNEMALKYFGIDKSKIVGHSVSDFTEQDVADHFEQAFEVIVKHKQSVSIQTISKVPHAISIYGFYMSPHFDDDDCVTHIDIIGQLDVSDHSMLHRERDDAISLLSSVFEVSEIGIVVTDDAGNIVRVNNSFIRTYGWSRNDLMNTEFITLITPDDRDEVQTIHKKCLESGSHHSGELRIIRNDGTIANVLSTTATLDLSQKRRYQVTTLMDITLRKRMEESLRMAKEQADAANRAKSMFLANMSHELRTPLNAIIGFSEMMIKGTFGALKNKKYHEYMEDIHVSAEHLLEIINEVLDMSKIEAGRLDLDETAVDVRELLNGITRMMASRAFGKKIELDLKVEKRIAPVYVDERLIRQALINLITNAIKFSHTGSDVHVSAQTLRDNSIEIKIQDYGVGIPKDKIKQALEPFGQISERAEDADHQGTGLGLPLAKAMVELHDGLLQIRSEVDKGTTAIISLPPSRTLPNVGDASKLRIR